MQATVLQYTKTHVKSCLVTVMTLRRQKRRPKTFIERLAHGSTRFRQVRTLSRRVPVHPIRILIDVERPFRVYQRRREPHRTIA